MIKTIPVNGPGAGSDAGDRRRWAGKKKVRMWGLEKRRVRKRDEKLWASGSNLASLCGSKDTRRKDQPKAFSYIDRLQAVTTAARVHAP